MQIVPVDNIPSEFKNTMSSSGFGRYILFTQELTRTTFLQQDSSKKALAVLRGLYGVDFPYGNISINRATIAQWKSINRPSHMGVFAFDITHRLYLVQGILDNTLLSFDGIPDTPNLII